MEFSNNQGRYSRQIRLPEIGAGGQEKLLAARVLVVGAGALGSAALLYLASAGVGTIGIVDSDELELSNLHRQVLYSMDDVGKPKVMAAAGRLAAMNPEISVIPHLTRLNIHNVLEIIGNYDVVLECSDNFPTKFLVNDACVILGKPCIIGAALGFTGQLSVYNYKEGPTYRCLLPDPPDSLLAPSCADVGVMGMIPGIIGNMQALEAIKVITGAGETLSGRLLHYDGLEGRFTEIEIEPVPANKNITELTQYEIACPDNLLRKFLISETEFTERLKDEKSHVVIAFAEDDRPVVFEKYTWNPVPLYWLPEVMSSIPADKNILLVCEYGIKSAEALKYLLVKENFTKAYSLINGLAPLRIKPTE